MEDRNLELELRDIHVLLAKNTVLMEALADQLKEAKEERESLDKRIEELERLYLLEAGKQQGVEKANNKVELLAKYAFSVIGVISTLLSAAWALFNYGAK